jgi:hypothetical protein
LNVRVNDIANDRKRVEEGEEEALDYGDQNRELDKLECKQVVFTKFFKFSCQYTTFIDSGTNFHCVHVFVVIHRFFKNSQLQTRLSRQR